MVFTKDYIAVGYHPEIGELDLAEPGHVKIDGTVLCVDASLIAPVQDIHFGTPVTLTLSIHGDGAE